MNHLIKKNIPLHDKTWFGTGGPARYFAEPCTAQEFADALAFAREHKLAVFVLGQGANVLISDDGFDGLVIRPRMVEIQPFVLSLSKPVLRKLEEDTDTTEFYVKAGAGVSMHNLIEYCLNNNLVGLEEFSGIPGTVGGSVYINLHYFQFLLEQFLVNAQVIHKASGEILEVSPDWFEFGYNHSQLHDEEYYLLNATFKLKKATDIETAYAKGRSVEIIRHRTARYPSKNTCGSFFRNFRDDEVTIVSNGKKMIYVAYYLDKIGVKGQLAVGNAIVSYQHANMIVNSGAATTTDIIGVARRMQELVFEHFGIVPQPECRLIGFKEYPLHSVRILRQAQDERCKELEV